MERLAIHRALLRAMLAMAVAVPVGCGRQSDGKQSNGDPAASDAAAEPRRSGCSLVTRSEMETILGGPIEPPVDSTDASHTKCSYPVPGGLSAVGIQVDWNGGAAGWKGVSLGKTVMDKTTAGMGMGDFNEPVAGLGDEAFVQSVKMPKLPAGSIGGIDLSSLASGEGVLWVKKGKAIMSVTVANQDSAKDKAIAVARVALGRM